MQETTSPRYSKSISQSTSVPTAQPSIASATNIVGTITERLNAVLGVLDDRRTAIRGAFPQEVRAKDDVPSRGLVPALQDLEALVCKIEDLAAAL